MHASSVRRGGFTLRPNFARNQWLKAIAIALFCLAVGVGMSTYAYVILNEVLRVSAVWEHGAEAQGEIAYEGNVRTHQLIMKSYDLKVAYLPEGAQEPVEFEADFMRFGSGPDDGDPIGVRYLRDDPAQAVTTWQHDGILHDWVWFALVTAMGVGLTVAAWVIVRKTARTVENVEHLAREGQLVYARVESVKRENHSGQTVVQLAYRTSRGDTIKQTFTFGQEPYLDESGHQVLVLSSLDERCTHALAADGFPLAQRPEPPAAASGA